MANFGYEHESQLPGKPAFLLLEGAQAGTTSLPEHTGDFIIGSWRLTEPKKTDEKAVLFNFSPEQRMRLLEEVNLKLTRVNHELSQIASATTALQSISTGSSIVSLVLDEATQKLMSNHAQLEGVRRELENALSQMKEKPSRLIKAQLISIYSQVFVAEVFIGGQPTSFEVVSYLATKDPDFISKVSKVRHWLRHLDWGERLLKAIDEWMEKAVNEYRENMAAILLMLKDAQVRNFIEQIKEADVSFRELLEVVDACERSKSDDKVRECLKAVVEAGLELKVVGTLHSILFTYFIRANITGSRT